MHGITLDEYTDFILKYMDDTHHLLGEHSRSVAKVSLAIMDRIGINGKDKETIKYGALLHDIGKLYMPKSILFAPRKLSEKEFELIKDHPLKGYELLKNIKSLENINCFILYHHYRNGNGYPDIVYTPVDAVLLDVLTVADSFCAIKEKRLYNGHTGMNSKKAIKILKNEDDDKNKGLNQEVVDVLAGLKL
ncbi:MAG: HD-GYP domain-containing protein [bacterium]|jgi:putative nucleotidyltransferase with HDIG domain